MRIERILVLGATGLIGAPGLLLRRRAEEFVGALLGPGRAIRPDVRTVDAGRLEYRADPEEVSGRGRARTRIS